MNGVGWRVPLVLYLIGTSTPLHEATFCPTWADPGIHCSCTYKPDTCIIIMCNDIEHPSFLSDLTLGAGHIHTQNDGLLRWTIISTMLNIRLENIRLEGSIILGIQTTHITVW